MLQSFRVRILLWFTGVAFVILAAFLFVAYQNIRGSLYRNLDSSLQTETAWMLNVLTSYRARGASDEDTQKDIWERSRLSPRKEFIEVYLAGGKLYFRSPNLEADNNLRELARASGVRPATVTFYGFPVRVFCLEDSLFEINLAYPLTDTDAALEDILQAAYYMIPIALLLYVLGGMFLLTRFMRPIRWLSRYAEGLIHHPLTQDLPKAPNIADPELDLLIRHVTVAVQNMRESLRQTLGFSSLTSHELRAPLAIMRNDLELALGEKIDPASRQSILASAYDEVLRMANIVDRLLSLGSMVAGRMTLERKDVVLSDLLLPFEEEAKVLCEPKGITFELRSLPNIMFKADSGLLRQVLYNLLDNAIKFTEPGGKTWCEAALEDGRIRIDFSDTGCGIADEEMKFVFDPFFRAMESSHRVRGLGLGLALCRRIVELHGGTIAVRSAPGRGSTFTIHLPVNPPSVLENPT